MKVILFSALRKALPSRPVIAGFLLALFVAPLSMTYFGALHTALHADAQDSDHQCAVKLLEQGTLDTADNVVAAPQVSIVLTPSSVCVTGVLPSPAAELPPGRAPPALFL